MFGIGGFELFIILIFGFLIFGPDKLPEIAKTVGKGIARFREAQAEMNDTLGGETIFDPNNPDEPFKDPVEVLDRIAQKQEDKKAGKAAAAAGATGAAAKSKPTTAKAAPVAAASETAPSQSAQSGAAKQESFTERKARYERERAARKAAEAEAAAAANSDSGNDSKSGNGAAGVRAERPADSSESAKVAPATHDGAVAPDAAAPSEPATTEGGDA